MDWEIQGHRELLRKVYDEKYENLDRVQKKIHQEKKEEEKRKKKEEQEEEKKIREKRNQIDCRKRRLAEMFKVFWNPLYFLQQTPKSIFDEREKDWMTHGGRDLWENATDGKNGANGKHGQTGFIFLFLNYYY